MVVTAILTPRHPDGALALRTTPAQRPAVAAGTERLLSIDVMNRSGVAPKASPGIPRLLTRDARRKETTLTAVHPTLGVRLDATLIEDSIGLAAVCADCILRISGLPSSRLIDALPRLIGALRVASVLGVCGSCLRQRVVHRRE